MAAASAEGPPATSTARSILVMGAEHKQYVYVCQTDRLFSRLNNAFNLPRMDAFSKAFAEYLNHPDRVKAAISRELGLKDPQVLNNWLRRGVPHKERARVAAVCGLGALLHPELTMKVHKERGKALDPKWAALQWSGKRALSPAQHKLWTAVLMWLEDLPDSPCIAIESLINFAAHAAEAATQKTRKRVHS